MQTEKNKKIGLLILILGTVMFFISILFFGQSGTRVEYRNLNYMLKTFCSEGIIFLTLYFGLYFTSGKKLAIQISGGLLLLLSLAYLFGYLFY